MANKYRIHAFNYMQLEVYKGLDLHKQKRFFVQMFSSEKHRLIKGQIQILLTMNFRKFINELISFDFSEAESRMQGILDEMVKVTIDVRLSVNVNCIEVDFIDPDFEEVIEYSEDVDFTDFEKVEYVTLASVTCDCNSSTCELRYDNEDEIYLHLREVFKNEIEELKEQAPAHIDFSKLSLWLLPPDESIENQLMHQEATTPKELVESVASFPENFDDKQKPLVRLAKILLQIKDYEDYKDYQKGLRYHFDLWRNENDI